jgi:hypothetical protein
MHQTDKQGFTISLEVRAESGKEFGALGGIYLGSSDYQYEFILLAFLLYG